jgi:hypothetical protein
MTTNEKLFLSSGCTKCCSSKDRPKRPTGYPEVSYSLFTLGTRDAGDHNGSRERERMNTPSQHHRLERRTATRNSAQ